MGVAEALTTKWYYVEVNKLVPCSHCINTPAAKEPTLFVLSDLKLKIEKGDYFVQCKSSTSDIRMDALVPDLVRFPLVCSVGLPDAV